MQVEVATKNESAYHVNEEKLGQIFRLRMVAETSLSSSCFRSFFIAIIGLNMSNLSQL